MKRSEFSILVNALSLIVLMCMISTGLILKFILPPGSGRIETFMYGQGRHGKTINVLMGLTRHEWGEVHLYLAFAFLVLIAVHLILHWNWLKAVTLGTKENPQSLRRKAAAIAVIIFAVVCVISPWLMKKKSYIKAANEITMDSLPKD